MSESPRAVVPLSPLTLFREQVLSRLAARHRRGALTANGDQAVEAQFADGATDQAADDLAVRIIQRGWVE